MGSVGGSRREGTSLEREKSGAVSPTGRCLGVGAVLWLYSTSIIFSDRPPWPCVLQGVTVSEQRLRRKLAPRQPYFLLASRLAGRCALYTIAPGAVLVSCCLFCFCFVGVFVSGMGHACGSCSCRVRVSVVPVPSFSSFFIFFFCPGVCPSAVVGGRWRVLMGWGGSSCRGTLASPPTKQLVVAHSFFPAVKVSAAFLQQQQDKMCL